MRPFSLYTAAVLGAVVSGGAFGADADGYFTVKGAGATSCRAYSEAVSERGQAFVSFGGWIEGYLSAMNRYEAGVYDIAGWRGTEALMASIARFCADNPGVGFHDVMVRLTEQLRATALTAQSEPVEASGETGSMTVPAEVVRRVQTRLYERGIYSGEIDGRWSSATFEALQAFQEAKGLPEHGLPDQQTLVQLLP